MQFNRQSRSNHKIAKTKYLVFGYATQVSQFDRSRKEPGAKVGAESGDDGQSEVTKIKAAAMPDSLSIVCESRTLNFG